MQWLMVHSFVSTEKKKGIAVLGLMYNIILRD